jgi:hypothetical protein
VLHEALQIQAHLQVQDQILQRLLAALPGAASTDETPPA